MPYFSWKGVDLAGNTVRGVQFAHSSAHLATQLHNQNIALLVGRQRRRLFARRGVPGSAQVRVFKELASLLRAGILSPQALVLLADQASHEQLKDNLHATAQAVQCGGTLAQSLADHTSFGVLAVAIVEAGERSGNVIHALEQVYDYLSFTQQFRKKISAALILPAITFAFFVVVVLIIFIFIVPHVVSTFATMMPTLPDATQRLLMVSNAICSVQTWVVLVGLLAGSSAVSVLARRRPRWRIQRDAFLLKLPMIGSFIRMRALVSFLRAFALLCEGGVHVVPALRVAVHALGNYSLRERVGNVLRAVECGSTLAQALHCAPDLFPEDVIAMVCVGEESGELAPVLAHAAANHQERLYVQLAWWTTLVQPLLMIILGACVALLIFCVYLPIFDLSYQVSLQ